MNLGEIGWAGIDRFDLTRTWTSGGDFVNTVMNLWVP
jgi:hypothetical protein